jgi:hypothetical protein
MDIQKLTIGEVAAIEMAANSPISALGDPNAPKGRLMVALAHVIKKRENPNFSVKDAEAMTMDEVMALLDASDDEVEQGK